MDEVKIRFLTENDLDEVRQFDDLSGNYVEQWLEDNEDYAWGLFKNGKLIGYCTIGYADDCGSLIENYPGWTSDSLLLSDVFIHPEHRHNGYATQMINEVIKRRTETEKELVFLTLLYDRLSELYEKLGFSLIAEGIMVRDERLKSFSKMDVKYRTELFSGSGQRDAATVMAFETFELGNTDILETIMEKFLTNNSELYNQSAYYFDSLRNNGYIESLDFKKGVEFYKNILNEIKNVTGHKINYVLWLADMDVLLDKECYGKFYDAEIKDIDTYEVGQVVISDLGYDGTLYGYTELPICLENRLEVLKDVLKDIINDLENDELTIEMEEKLNVKYLEIDNKIQDIKLIISNKELIVNELKKTPFSQPHVDLDEKINNIKKTKEVNQQIEEKEIKLDFEINR